MTLSVDAREVAQNVLDAITDANWEAEDQLSQRFVDVIERVIAPVLHKTESDSAGGIMTPMLVQLAIQEAPSIIARLKDLFAKQNPGVPGPTDEEVLAAYESAFASSRAKDALWLQIHGS